MAKMLSLLSVIALLATGVFYLKAPRAGEVEHHGVTVNAKAHAMECISCHDGTIAKAVSNCVGVRCNNLKFRTDSHPVEKDYPARKSFVNYGEVERGGIVLDEGKISCISCHDLENQDRGHPAIKNRSENLCFRCHIK